MVASSLTEHTIPSVLLLGWAGTCSPTLSHKLKNWDNPDCPSQFWAREKPQETSSNNSSAPTRPCGLAWWKFRTFFKSFYYIWFQSLYSLSFSMEQVQIWIRSSIVECRFSKPSLHIRIPGSPVPRMPRSVTSESLGRGPSVGVCKAPRWFHHAVRVVKGSSSPLRDGLILNPRLETTSACVSEWQSGNPKAGRSGSMVQN